MSLPLPPNSSFDSSQSRCANNTDGSLIGTALIATRVLLLFPVSVFILCHGLQQKCQQRLFKARSHFEVFTYHQCILELIWILGTALMILGSAVGFPAITLAGVYLTGSIFPGEILFHVLTCLDRYLAAVHPITYQSLRNGRGVASRNIVILTVWLVSGLFTCAANILDSNLFIYIFFSFLASSLVLVFLCSFSVLCSLIDGGPGESLGNKKHVNQTRKRAFVTVAAIMIVLCLSFFGYLVTIIIKTSQPLMTSVFCVLEISVLWLTLPSSLILPVLYLLKIVKQPRGHHNSD